LWTAPEQVNTQITTYKTDIYSLGVVIWQIITQSMPYQKYDLTTIEDHIKIESLILNNKFFEINILPEHILKIIIKKCLETNPNCRSSLSEIYQDVSKLSN